MNKHQVQAVDRVVRIDQYVSRHAIPIPRAAVLLTELDTLHAQMLDYGSGQEGGLNTYLSGATQRWELRAELLFLAREISETAKGLDPAEHPGISDLFRLNDARASYQNLLNTCASFVDHLADPAVKALFTDRGFDADFETQLTQKLAEFAAATGIKDRGRQQQKTGTVGLDALTRRAAVVVRELSVIVVKYLRKTNPQLIPVWKAAARVYTPAVSKAQPSASEPATSTTIAPSPAPQPESIAAKEKARPFMPGRALKTELCAAYAFGASSVEAVVPAAGCCAFAKSWPRVW